MTAAYGEQRTQRVPSSYDTSRDQPTGLVPRNVFLPVLNPVDVENHVRMMLFIDTTRDPPYAFQSALRLLASPRVAAVFQVVLGHPEQRLAQLAQPVGRLGERTAVTALNRTRFRLTPAIVAKAGQVRAVR